MTLRHWVCSYKLNIEWSQIYRVSHKNCPLLSDTNTVRLGVDYSYKVNIDWSQIYRVSHKNCTSLVQLCCGHIGSIMDQVTSHDRSRRHRRRGRRRSVWWLRVRCLGRQECCVKGGNIESVKNQQITSHRIDKWWESETKRSSNNSGLYSAIMGNSIYIEQELTGCWVGNVIGLKKACCSRILVT